jgi:hypothetical protein
VEFCIPPTAKQTVVVGQSIPSSANVLAPTIRCVHVAPPSLVLRIEAPSAAKQVETLGQLMSLIHPLLISYRLSQVLPPSVVPRMTAGYGPPFLCTKLSLPTTKQVSVLGHLTRINGSLVTVEVKKYHELPPSPVVVITPLSAPL